MGIVKYGKERLIKNKLWRSTQFIFNLKKGSKYFKMFGLYGPIILFLLMYIILHIHNKATFVPALLKDLSLHKEYPIDCLSLATLSIHKS